LADVEGSTRLWQTRPEEIPAVLARLDEEVSAAIAAHGGVRPVEQGEGDSFVVAFARASDAVACALALQRAPLAPIRLRIGVHTGQVQLRDEGNYAGPTINRAARLRDLAHGGQTALSGATEQLVVDWLPADAISHAPNGSCSYAIPTRTTNSRHCAHLRLSLLTICQRSSRILLGAKRR
jgi:class 3 adenylate cyclase